MATAKSPVGLTTSQGWEMGIRRTFPIDTGQAWELMFTQPILEHWLDDKASIAFEKGDSYTTNNGISISISSVTPHKVIRMKWQRKGETSASTLQIRVMPAKGKATISIHHEWLQDADDRVRMKAYWENVLDKIAALI